MSSSEKKITLKSSDGEDFVITEAAALQSQIIKYLIEDDCVDNAIPVPNVTSKILSKIILYCNKHVDSDSTSTPDDVKAFDADFVKVDYDTLFDLILAAHYLEIESLSDLTYQTIMGMLEGKTIRETRKAFSLNDHFITPEEEEEEEERLLLSHVFF